jgi:hypothetical protein
MGRLTTARFPRERGFAVTMAAVKFLERSSHPTRQQSRYAQLASHAHPFALPQRRDPRLMAPIIKRDPSDPPELYLPDAAGEPSTISSPEDGPRDNPDTWLSAYDITPDQFSTNGPWFAVLTSPRKEKSLAGHLYSLGFPYFLPYRRRYTACRHYVALPLFPSVVFVGREASAIPHTKFDLARLHPAWVRTHLTTRDQPRLVQELALIAAEPTESRCIRLGEPLPPVGSQARFKAYRIQAPHTVQLLNSLSNPARAGHPVRLTLYPPTDSSGYGGEPMFLTAKVSQETAALIREGSKLRPKVYVDLHMLGQTVVVEVDPSQVALEPGVPIPAEASFFPEPAI